MRAPLRLFTIGISIGLSMLLHMESLQLNLTRSACAQETQAERPGSGHPISGDDTAVGGARKLVILPRVGNIRQAPGFQAPQRQQQRMKDS